MNAETSNTDKPTHSLCVVSMSKIHLPPKSTGNTQEAVASSRYD